jgi:hypothetical protein
MSIVSWVRRSEQSLAKPVASHGGKSTGPSTQKLVAVELWGSSGDATHSAACRPAHHRHNPLAELISHRVPHWVTAAPALPALSLHAAAPRPLPSKRRLIRCTLPLVSRNVLRGRTC